MDEHIKVSGKTARLKGILVDENLNSLTWWTNKHNLYASREAVDLLNLDHGLFPHDTVASFSRTSSQASVKRFVKEKIYAQLPSGVRALLYFLYRYTLLLGFLDGRSGSVYHVLQGFWYRYLVDQKMNEVRRHMVRTGDDAPTAVFRVLGIAVDASESKYTTTAAAPPDVNDESV